MPNEDRAIWSVLLSTWRNFAYLAFQSVPCGDFDQTALMLVVTVSFFPRPNLPPGERKGQAVSPLIPPTPPISLRFFSAADSTDYICVKYDCKTNRITFWSCKWCYKYDIVYLFPPPPPLPPHPTPSPHTHIWLWDRNHSKSRGGGKKLTSCFLPPPSPPIGLPVSIFLFVCIEFW